MAVVDSMLGNAAVAAGLALVAVAVGCACRSPAVRHAAWLLVLLKLVTPPLIVVPLCVLPASGAWWERDWLARAADWALAVWAAGALGWFGWQGRRVVRFHRLVRRAEGAPAEVVAAAGRIATALGIARPPAVKVVSGTSSPMLWGWGRGTVVLFPRGLLDRLAPEARDTLLAHELAHFLRRDHWVRVLEFVATGLYWWHPAVWLARPGIEAAEEECCDSWVVGGLAASPRRYAEALLATVDYDAELRRPCLPPTACAARRGARLLHRRLVEIIHTDRPRRLRGGVAVRAVLLGALLVQPVLRAAIPEAAAPSPESVSAAPAARAAPGRRPAVPRPTRPKPAEPRAWATAVAPGGELTVLARDREFVLRHSDGTSAFLGPGRPLALTFAPAGGRLATAGPGPLVRTWDDHGGLLATASVPAAAWAIAWMPDGSRILVLDAGGGISVLDALTLARLDGWSVEGPANGLVCSPDGRTVAVAFGSWLAESGWVECWSVPDRRKLATYPAPAPVGATRFGPDGRTMVIGGWNGLTVWRALPGGELLAERQLPKDLVANAAFCPDGGTLPLEPPPEPAPPPLSPLSPRQAAESLHGVGNFPGR